MNALSNKTIRRKGRIDTLSALIIFEINPVWLEMLVPHRSKGSSETAKQNVPDSLSRGTFVEQALPRKIVQQHPTVREGV
jgi:hypothetical protein